MPRKTKRQLHEEARRATEALIEKEAEESIAEKGERVPGKVVHGIKTPWTRGDIERAFGIVEFVPGETIAFIYNGVMFQLIADAKNTVPTIIKQMYEERQRKMRRAGTRLPDVGFETIIGLGAGPLPPET